MQWWLYRSTTECNATDRKYCYLSGYMVLRLRNVSTCRRDVHLSLRRRCRWKIILEILTANARHNLWHDTLLSTEQSGAAPPLRISAIGMFISHMSVRTACTESIKWPWKRQSERDSRSPQFLMQVMQVSEREKLPTNLTKPNQPTGRPAKDRVM